MNVDKLIKDLPVIDWVEASKPTFFIDIRGNFCISGEDGLCLIDYYGEVNNGYPFIHPELVEYAAAAGGYFDWANPGAVMFVEN